MLTELEDVTFLDHVLIQDSWCIVFYLLLIFIVIYEWIQIQEKTREPLVSKVTEFIEEVLLISLTKL